MIAWQLAEQWQRENDATAEFSELLGQHLSTGVVHSTPQLFMLAGEVRWNPEEKHFEDGEPNCWFVRLAAGAGCANAPWGLMRVFPRSHRYVAWFRRNGFEPRVYDWAKLLNRVKGDLIWEA